MRRLLFLMLCLSPSLFGYSSISGWCEQGGIKTAAAGQQSVTYQQQSYPNFTQSGAGPSVTVYIANTTNKATLYSDSSGTGTDNAALCTATGQFKFFAANGFYDLLFSGTGISSFTIAGVQITGSTNVLACGAFGNQTANDTTAATNCITQAAQISAAAYFPAGTYGICNVAPSLSSKSVVIYGDGPKSTMFVTHSSCAGQSVDMMDLNTTGAVYLHDFGIDSLNTSDTPFSGNDIQIGPKTSTATTTHGPSKVDVDHLYIAHGQVVGLSITNASNVTVSNTTTYQNDWFGLAVSCGFGGTADPTYSTGFNFHGNTHINEPIGEAVNFFCSNVAVTGETFTQSSLDFVQTPDLKGTVSGVTIQGYPTYGCIVLAINCAGYVSYNSLFNEGVNGLDTGDTWISDGNSGQEAGLFCIGSSLILSGGPQIDLPCKKLSIHSLHIDTMYGNPVNISALSNGSLPTAGTQISYKTSTVENSNGESVFTGINGLDVTGNTGDNLQNGGMTFGNDQDVKIQSNLCHNCNVAGGTTYSTGTISGSMGSASITGSGTTFTSGMVHGGLTVNGTTYTVCSFSSATSIALCSPLVTAASAAVYMLYYGGGGNFSGITFANTIYKASVAGNKFLNDAGNALFVGINDTTGLTPAQSLITYDNANSCDAGCSIYSPAPSYHPVASACGSVSGTLSAATNQGGVISGTGSATSCTVTFAGDGFTGNASTVPFCTLGTIPATSSISSIGFSSISNTAFTVAVSGGQNLLGNAFIWQCAPSQANQGQYPYPYFWQ